MEESSVELLRNAVGLGGIPLVVIFVNESKKIWQNAPGEAWPSLAIVYGILLNVALALILHANLEVAVLVGVIVGFKASEAYERGNTKPAG